MSAREIMAEAILSAGEAMGALAHRHAGTFEEKVVAFQVEALTTAGYRIIGPGELDRETLERAAGIDPKRFSSEDVAIEVLASIRALTGKAGEA